jgi:hypothetical protein
VDSSRLLILLASLATVGVAGGAEAQDRAGQGRIQLAAGPRWIPNAGFFYEARSLGYDVGSRSYGVSPIGMATFAYWIDEHLEFSLEGTLSYDSYGPAWSVQSATIGGTLRFSPLTDSPLWPYVGGNFGYSLNGVSTPLTAPLNTFSAEGYGGSLLIGTGLDLSTHFGVSFELRYTITSIAIPPYFHSNLNAGGLSFFIGGYLRLPKPHETMEPHIPNSLDQELPPTP